MTVPIPHLSDGDIVQRASGVHGTMLDGGFVLLDPASSSYVTLNGVGGRIWESIETPIAVEALIDALTAAFDVDRERCRAELDTFVAGLRARGLVTVTPARAPSP